MKVYGRHRDGRCGSPGITVSSVPAPHVPRQLEFKQSFQDKTKAKIIWNGRLIHPSCTRITRIRSVRAVLRLTTGSMLRMALPNLLTETQSTTIMRLSSNELPVVNLVAVGAYRTRSCRPRRCCVRQAPAEQSSLLSCQIRSKIGCLINRMAFAHKATKMPALPALLNPSFPADI